MYEQIDKKTRNYAKELASLSEKDIEKIERVCSALEKRFNAEAEKESQQKFRILFERAGKEWLPFIIYCLTFAPVAGVSVYRIVDLEGWWQIGAWIALIMIMLIPVFFAPYLHKFTNREKTDLSSYEPTS